MQNSRVTVGERSPAHDSPCSPTWLLVSIVWLPFCARCGEALLRSLRSSAMPRILRSLLSAFAVCRTAPTPSVSPAIRDLRVASRPVSSIVLQPRLHNPSPPFWTSAVARFNFAPAQLGGLQQVRFAARGTEYQPSQRVRKRRHGFLARKRTASGRRVLVRRRLKGRRYLSH